MRYFIPLFQLLFASYCGGQEIAGIITDGSKDRLINVSIQAFHQSVLKGGTITDFDGAFSIKPLDTGIYDLVIKYYGYDSIFIKAVAVKQFGKVIINREMHLSPQQPTTYYKPKCRLFPPDYPYNGARDTSQDLKLNKMPVTTFHTLVNNSIGVLKLTLAGSGAVSFFIFEDGLFFEIGSRNIGSNYIILEE